MSRVIREPHLDLRNTRAQRSTHDAGSAESTYAFPGEEDSAAGGDETEGRVESIALVDHLRFKAGLAAHSHERVVVAGGETPREQDEAFAAERRQRERSSPCEPMTFGKYDHDWFTDDRLHGHGAVTRGKSQKAGVNLSLAKRLELFAGPEKLERELDIRIPLAEGRQQSREDVQLGGCHVADQELPRFSTRSAAGDFSRVLRLCERRSSLQEKGAPGVSELNAAVRPIEEPHAQVLFEPTDLLTEGRLCDVNALRGSTEVEFFRNRDEVPEVTKLHDRTIS